MRPAMPDAHGQIQVDEANVAQLAAWNRLWRRLLSDAEPSKDMEAKENPAPAHKTDARLSGEG
jgi:hypothetical protein